MPTPDQLSLARRLLQGLGPPWAEHRLRNVTIPLSAVTAVVRSSLDANPFFPPNARPDQLGDGALIERRRKHHFLVHERFEVGQLRYSEISSHSCFSLRSAVLRYLKHYRPLLRADKVSIRRWS
jgi:hypothetical protein